MREKTITIGKSVIRKDAPAKVTGRAKYVADLRPANMKYGAVVRSIYHHAQILAIHKEEALNVPGVIAVITAADIPGEKVYGSLIEDRPALAIDKVRHYGEPVALVIAENKHSARTACKLVRVEYKELPAVFDAAEALAPDAPKVHPEGNLVTEYDVQDGNLEDGFAKADVVLEDTFYVPRISPAYLEKEASLASWHKNGMITVWVSSQEPFFDRFHIAQVLGIPIEDVQVKSAVIGGAFGGKEDSGIAVLAALAAWLTKSTVQMDNNRAESFLAHPKRHPAQLRYRIGAKNDGTLVALDATVYLDTGAFASYGPAVGGLLTEMIPGVYRIPNVRAHTLVVYTNSPFSGAMRGFGSPQAHFALESILNMLADKLQIDALELRKKNLLRTGDHFFTKVVVGETAKSLPLIVQHTAETVKRLRNKTETPGKLAGVGLAFSNQSMGLGNKVPDDSTNRMEWLPDGKVKLYLGAPDMGQGLATVSEQIVAEVLGLPYSWVHTAELDTKIVPDGGVSCASRMTYLVGNSVHLAARRMLDKLLDFAAQGLDIPRENLLYRDRYIQTPAGDRIPVQEFTSRAADEGLPLGAEATFSFPYPEDTTPQHLPIGMPHVKFCFGAQIARVEVDPELGTVDVTDLVAIHDVGRVINRAGVEGQIEGAVATGIGYALYEDVALKDDGNWVQSFTEYLLPTTKDVPSKIESIIVEVPEPDGPFGAKGVAEMGLVPTAPAIAEAIYKAVGVRAKKLPIRPETIALSLKTN